MTYPRIDSALSTAKPNSASVQTQHDPDLINEYYDALKGMLPQNIAVGVVVDFEVDKDVNYTWVDDEGILNEKYEEYRVASLPTSGLSSVLDLTSSKSGPRFRVDGYMSESRQLRVPQPHENDLSFLFWGFKDWEIPHRKAVSAAGYLASGISLMGNIHTGDDFEFFLEYVANAKNIAQGLAYAAAWGIAKFSSNEEINVAYRRLNDYLRTNYSTQDYTDIAQTTKIDERAAKAIEAEANANAEIQEDEDAPPIAFGQENQDDRPPDIENETRQEQPQESLKAVLMRNWYFVAPILLLMLIFLLSFLGRGKDEPDEPAPETT